MTRTYNMPLTKADLQALLDAHGADMARWPDEVRPHADALLADDCAARALLEEAEAFERLLDLAPPPVSAPSNALADRIVATALREAELGAAPAPFEVIDWPSPRKTGAPASFPSRSDAWRGAALLAASLMLGVFIGVSDGGSARLQDLAVAAGLASDADQELNVLDQNDLGGLGEEVL